MISEYYKNKLSGLKVDRSSGHPKPHKVCLLLALLKLVSERKVTKNEFVINDALKKGFGSYFIRLKKGNDAENIDLPFYHLHGDGIWHFTSKPGRQGDLDALLSNAATPSMRALFEVIDYAYLDEALFAYFKDAALIDIIKQLLLENLEDLSVQFHRWLIMMGKSEGTASKYVGAVKGSISRWANESGINDSNLIGIQSHSKIHRIAEELTNYEVFVERNTVGNNMYSCALISYEDFLADVCQVQVTDDIREIINDTTIDSTVKATLVNTRIGQGRFREDLIKYWKGCALTNYSAVQFLVASHIKPWKKANNQERLDSYNGLLLLPNLDKAFDLGYITFSDKGKLKISEFIEDPESLGIERSMKIKMAKQHQDYMTFHREFEFKR